MTLAETIVAMVIAGLLLGGVLSTVVFSAKLVASAPSDTNPHTFGALAAAVARLEGSAATEQTCANPAGANLRSGCLRVETAPPAAQDLYDGHGVLVHETCWVVGTGAGRRLECWELLAQGDLVARRYPPAGTVADPADALGITNWNHAAPDPAPVASGIVAFDWDTAGAAVELSSCAAIRPDQRRLMPDDEVPFCDGSTGVLLADGSPRAGTEGHPMPALRVFS